VSKGDSAVRNYCEGNMLRRKTIMTTSTHGFARAKGDTSDSKPSFRQCRQAGKGWNAVTVVPMFTTAGNGSPRAGAPVGRMD
jgi:hypothetical protein